MSFISRILGNDAPAEQILQAEANVGYDVEEWVSSAVGRYIIGRAEQYERQTLQELKNTSSLRIFKVMRLQNQAKTPAMFLQWLEQAIVEGREAGYQLTEMQD